MKINKNINKPLVVLGSGPWQSSILNTLRSYTDNLISVGPVDYNHNTDIHLEIDIRDHKKIIESINKLKIVPAYCFTSQSDAGVVSAAYINSFYECGLYNSIKVSEKFTNKKLIRDELIGAIRIQNPAYEILDKNDLKGYFKELNSFDKVIKPTGLQSSLGIVRAHNNSPEWFNQYMHELNILNVNEVIVEDFIEGEEYTVEGFKLKSGIHVILAISKKTKNIGFGIADKLNYTIENNKINEIIKDDLEHLFRNASFGPTHTELILTKDNEFYLVEAAIRTGGSNIPSIIVPAISGINQEEMYINQALNLCDYYDLNLYPKLNSVSLCFYTVSSRNYHGINLPASNEVKLLHAWSNFKLNQMVENVRDDRSRHGYIIVGADNQEFINKYCKLVMSKNKEITFYV